MNAELLLAHFNRISDAPDAVPRLRRFILDLAVRGKLVEQDHSDEPASELLKRIQAEKARLVQAGNARRATSLSQVKKDEAAFPAPFGWEWTRIRQATSARGQTVPDREFTYIDVTSINKEAGCIGDAKILAPADAPSRARKVVEKGDVLYSCVRPYLLNIAVIETEIVPAPIASTAFAVLNGFGLVISKYMWVVLRSPFMVECVEAKMRGQAYPAINDSDFSELPFPLPPLAEQHRIVAKVDELMALCDRLEAAQRDRESRRDRLTSATHHHLNNGADAEVTHGYAQFFIGHLPRITARPNQIKQLRQTILSLAVRGSLVNQDSRDETAFDLLQGIFSSKAEMAKLKRALSALKPVPKSDARVPAQIPGTWEWATTDLICEVIVDCPHSTPVFQASGVACVDTNSFKGGVILESKLRYVSEESYVERVRRTIPRSGDVIFAREGSVGESVILPVGLRCCLGQRVMLFRLATGILPEYFQLAISEATSLTRLVALRKGIGAKHVNIADMREALVPIPPRAEQHRIIAKVDELMALCDRLESRLITAQTEATRLLESVLHRALQAST
jgi:type I restriction enzyme S subunit